MGHYRQATDSFCNGKMETFWIREHNFSFQRCNVCGNYAGYKTKERVNQLMQTKVSPTIRKL